MGLNLAGNWYTARRGTYINQNIIVKKSILRFFFCLSHFKKSELNMHSLYNIILE